MRGWWRTIKGTSSRASRYLRKVNFKLKGQGNGPSSSWSTRCLTWVQRHAQAWFGLSFSGRSRGDNFLHTPPSFSLRSHVSNKPSCKSFGVYFGQSTSRNPKLLSTELNPAHRKLWVCLDAFLNSKFCETLGHKNTSKYYQNMPLKLR